MDAVCSKSGGFEARDAAQSVWFCAPSQDAAGQADPKQVSNNNTTLDYELAYSHHKGEQASTVSVLWMQVWQTS